MHYKFERFSDPGFPIYSAVQKGAGTLVSPHYHKAYELIEISAGSPLLYIDAGVYRCKAGDIFFIPPFAVHSLQSETEDCIIRGITFEGKLLDEIACNIALDEILSRECVASFCTREGDLLHQGMQSRFEKVFDAYHTPSSTRRIAILSALYGLLEMLLMKYAPKAKTSRNERRILPAIRYMEAHYPETITLASISNELNMCNDHTIRLFKAITNKTPIQFLTDLRLSEAIKLLVETDLSIGEIAVRTGFSDANYFSKVFKDRLCRSPRDYRKLQMDQKI